MAKTDTRLTAVELQSIVGHALRRQIMAELKIDEVCHIKVAYHCDQGRGVEPTPVHWDSASDNPADPFIVTHCRWCLRFQIRKVRIKTLESL